MKVYLSGRFVHRLTLRWLRNALLARHGLTVTSRWIDYEDTPRDAQIRMQRAIENMLDLQEADVLLYLCSPVPGHGARFVELGLALAYGLRIVMVGEREPHIFATMPQVEYVDSVGQVLAHLGVSGSERGALPHEGSRC